MSKAGESTVSPEKQREACLAVCESHGWSYELFEDLEGWRSGRFEATRPAWLALKERLKQGPSDGRVAAVVVYRLDRASRSPKDFFNFLSLLQETKTDLISATQDLDTSSPYGRMFVGLLSLWAGLEAEITSERTRETIAWKQAHGIHVGDVPIGYRREKQTIHLNGDSVTTSILLVDDEGARIVRRIYELYATGDYSFRALADHLNALGHRTRGKRQQNGLFSHKSIQVILSNHWLYRGYVVRNEGKPGEEIVKGVHPPLIADDLASAVQGVAVSWHDRLPKRREKPTHTFILAGLHCALCGGELRGVVERGRAVYRHDKPKGKCPARQSDADALEQGFLSLFAGLTLTDEQVERIGRDWDLHPSAEGQKEGERRKQAQYLDQRAARARRLYLAGDLSDEEYEAERRQLERQRQTLGETGPSRQLTIRQMAEIVRHLGVAVQDMDAQRQRAMTLAMFERLETNGGEITRIVPRHLFSEFFHNLALFEDSRLRPLVPPGEFERPWGRIVTLFAERTVTVCDRQPHNAHQLGRNLIIRQLRSEDKLTLGAIAERYGLSVQRVWEICRG